MIPMDVKLLRRGDPPPLAGVQLDKMDLQHGDRLVSVYLLEGGMSSGAPSVVISVKKDDGKLFVFETSARLFVAAAATARALCEQIGFTDLAQL